jgi:hypothetical protein
MESGMFENEKMVTQAQPPRKSSEQTTSTLVENRQFSCTSSKHQIKQIAKTKTRVTL